MLKFEGEERVYCRYSKEFISIGAYITCTDF